MQKSLNRLFYSPIPGLLIWAGVVALLLWMMRANYLLFHVLSELFSIVIGATIFIITWNARAQIKNTALLVLGISFLFTGIFDLIHTLAYAGMNLIPGTLQGEPNASNLATQLWLAARFVQSAAALSLPIVYRWRVRSAWILSGFIAATALLFFSILVWEIFPTAYIDGSGLTDFKRASEYVIILGIVVGMGGLLRLRGQFPAAVTRWLLLAYGFTILSEMAFTIYISVASLMNGAGHVLKIIAFYFVYQAFVQIGLRRPQDLLFRELAERERQLEASERRERERAAQVEAFMDAAPAIVWIAHDKEAREITGNRASYEILRMHAADNMSKSAGEGRAPTHFWVLDVQGRELAPEDLPVQISAATGQAVRDYEEIIEFNDGQQVRLIGNVTPLQDDQGQPAGAVGAFIDITARARAEQALLESEARFRGLFESMTESFALLELLPDGAAGGSGNVDFRLIALNPALERMVDVKRGDLIGRTYRELLPDNPPQWIDRLVAVANSGQPDLLKDFPILEGRRFEVVAYQAGARQVALLGIDVTERYQNQAALELSEARLRRLVDANIIGILYFDQQGRISQVNDAFLNIIGYTREEIQGDGFDWAGLTPAEYVEFDRQRLDEAMTRGACTPYEKEFLRKGGRRVPVLVGYAYFDGDQEAPFIGFVLDLTVQKRADMASRDYAARLERINLELARANGELQDFAFMASHDLQEPLRKIQAFGERLAEREQSVLQEESRDYLERMLSAAKRMRAMINDLLSLSRIITRARPFQMVDLNEVVAEVLGDLELLIERSGGTVVVGELPQIQADPTQMHLLFQNLIGNALKFTRAGSPPLVKVDSSATDDGKSVMLIVQDNGIGFEEKFLDRIFQPFQRLHGRMQFDGSGIGLAVCRKIVERHFGAITARSRPNEGATFIVTLPMRQEDDNASPAGGMIGGSSGASTETEQVGTNEAGGFSA